MANCTINVINIYNKCNLLYNLKIENKFRASLADPRVLFYKPLRGPWTNV